MGDKDFDFGGHPGTKGVCFFSLNANGRCVLFDVAREERSWLGLVGNCGDQARKLLVQNANSGSHVGFDLVDLGFVDIDFDLHLLEVRQPQDCLTFADCGSFFD